jgi:glycosyltransferase involved in cell wall biosynthesis
MHKKNKNEIIELLKDMNIQSDCVVVNQCDKDSTECITYKDYYITIVYSTDRGLSRSRNLALQNADADIVVIADDDMRYVDEYPQIILRAYESHAYDDILTFKVKNDKKYFSQEKKLNKILIQKVSSVEITMRLNAVKYIKFNDLFGTGSEYFQCGEESIFLKDCINSKKHIKYMPIKMASLLDNRPSTWFMGYDRKRLVDLGAVYYELSHFGCIIFIFRFVVQRHGLYKKNMDIVHAVYYMIYGVIKYINIKKRMLWKYK